MAGNGSEARECGRLLVSLAVFLANFAYFCPFIFLTHSSKIKTATK